MRRHRISWTLYLVGSLLVFGSWINVVPAALGWCGWLAALAGWAIGSSAPRRVVQEPAQLSKPDEIAKLEMLRKEGIITDEDFAEGKARILRGP
jgi:hypothetical protein